MTCKHLPKYEIVCYQMVCFLEGRNVSFIILLSWRMKKSFLIGSAIRKVQSFRKIKGKNEIECMVWLFGFGGGFFFLSFFLK